MYDCIPIFINLRLLNQQMKMNLFHLAPVLQLPITDGCGQTSRIAVKPALPNDTLAITEERIEPEWKGGNLDFDKWDYKMESKYDK